MSDKQEVVYQVRVAVTTSYAVTLEAEDAATAVAEALRMVDEGEAVWCGEDRTWSAYRDGYETRVIVRPTWDEVRAAGVRKGIQGYAAAT